MRKNCCFAKKHFICNYKVKSFSDSVCVSGKGKQSTNAWLNENNLNIFTLNAPSVEIFVSKIFMYNCHKKKKRKKKTVRLLLIWLYN